MLYLKTPWCPSDLMNIVWTLENFRCERLLQKTSHAEVYETTIRKIKVVIKRYSKGIDHVQIPYIIHEVEIHSRIHSPYVVALYGAFETQDHIYLIMEPCKTDLREHLNHMMDLQNYPLTEASFVVEILIPILLAIKYLHESNIIHRDLKPENILVDYDGNWKICDFGVAMNLYSNRATSLVGTLDYISPEVLDKRLVSTDNKKIDIWSIGIIVCECITGILLFHVSEELKRTLYANENQTALMKQIHNSIPASISQYARNFLQACLHVDNHKRSNIHTLLKHPWIQQYVNEKQKLDMIVILRRLCCI